MIVDTPPGTSDEHLSVLENLTQFSPEGALLVTTPQVIYIYLLLSFLFFVCLVLFFLSSHDPSCDPR